MLAEFAGIDRAGALQHLPQVRAELLAALGEVAQVVD